MAKVVIWRNGAVAVRPNKARPDGGLTVCRGDARAMKRAVEVVARHAYDGRTLLVPGIPEADTEVEALAAAKAFAEQIRKRVPSVRGGLL